MTLSYPATGAPAPAAPAAAEPFLRLSGVRKSYPGVLALDGLDLEVRPGEVIGLVGENGAGKSTLMKILGGVTTPDSGSIEVDGVPYAALTVGGSLRAGVAFVHQELNLFDNLDVAANVFIGREPRRFGVLNLVDTAKQRAAVQPLLEQLGANFSPETPVAKLSLAQQQLVEIAKALSQDARLVILDEPTSSLPIAETEKLLAVIDRLDIQVGVRHFRPPQMANEASSSAFDAFFVNRQCAPSKWSVTTPDAPDRCLATITSASPGRSESGLDWSSR